MCIIAVAASELRLDAGGEAAVYLQAGGLGNTVLVQLLRHHRQGDVVVDPVRTLLAWKLVLPYSPVST